MEVVKTNIKPEDVGKVMKDFDKKATAPKVVSPGLDMVPKDVIQPPKKVVEVPKKIEPKPKVKLKGIKTVTIDLSDVNIDVKFIGEGWKASDIKLSNATLIRAFKIKIRDAYRKGNK